MSTSANTSTEHPGSPPVRRRRRLNVRSTTVVLLLSVAAVVLAACSSSSSSSSTTATTVVVSISKLEVWPTTTVSVTESGSTLLQPLFTSWAAAINASHPTITVQPSGGGSGTGINNAATGVSNIGASDAYLSPAQTAQYPSLKNIPVAISAQQVNYNIPGLSASTHLKLNATVLADMYEGTITNWDSPDITKLNPGVSIPSTPVVTLHRADSSGDTFLFTSFLAAADPSWGAKYPPNTTIQWPAAPGATSATGNSGMVTTCAATPGCVAYIGISYLAQATQKGLGYAALANKSNQYVLPTTSSISTAASSFAGSLPSDGAQSMIYGPASGGYPIINYEYAIVGTQPDATHAAAVKAVLAWAIDPKGGNSSKYLVPVMFQPLPTQARNVALKLISQISS